MWYIDVPHWVKVKHWYYVLYGGQSPHCMGLICNFRGKPKNCHQCHKREAWTDRHNCYVCLCRLIFSLYEMFVSLCHISQRSSSVYNGQPCNQAGPLVPFKLETVWLHYRNHSRLKITFWPISPCPAD